MRFVKFMSTPAGRTIRVVMGLGLIAAGILIGGAGGWGLAVFGLLPLATGAADYCPICPMLNESGRVRAGCRGSTCS